MTPKPVVLAFTISDYLIVEEGTKKPSIIGCFRGIGVSHFPSAPRPFSIYVLLTDGSGQGILQLGVARVDTLEELHTYQKPIRFVDRLSEVEVRFRLKNCVIPEAGWYLFTLYVDGEALCQRRIQVYRIGEMP